MQTKIFFLIILFTYPFVGESQQYRSFDIRNCDGILQVATYDMDVMSPISMAVLGAWDISKNKTIKFSKSSNLNLDSLAKMINRVKGLLPNRFIAHHLGHFWYDNKPEEDDKIWFLRLYVEEKSKDKYDPFLAFKVTFEGSDAMKERIDAKVLKVEFITEKKTLQELVNRLKTLPEVH